MDFDNVYSRPVAQASTEARLGFIKRVYGWMAMGVALAALGTFLAIQSGIAYRMLGMGWMGAILMTVVWIASSWFATKVRHQSVINIVAFSIYGLVTGVVLSSLVLVAMLVATQTTGNPMTYVGQAFGITTLVFGGLSVYAATTKKDFSFLGGFLMMAMLALMGVMIVGFFVQSTMFALVVSFLAVLVFCAVILWETQTILRTYPENEHIAGAIALFTSFTVLFMHILRILTILGGRRD